MTNRDLYLFLASICDSPAFRERPLDEYLLALWRLTQPHRDSEPVSPGDFRHLLELAFTAEVPPYPEEWRHRAEAGDSPGYAGWEAVLAEQVTDLREMAASGALENPHRYFGLQSPRRHSWYNFDAATYLECAAAGTFGAWIPADDLDSESTPPPTFPPRPDTPPVENDYQTLRRSIHTLTTIPWDLFRGFLRAGQWYE